VAYAAPWKARAAYDWCAEVAVYVAAHCARQGIGRRLYQRLLPVLDQQGYHTQVAVIALPNPASTRLHESFGFQHAGTLREVGHKHGAWRDVGFWQRHARCALPATPPTPVPELE
jgi:phosphinothricin acetyltransferase